MSENEGTTYQDDLVANYERLRVERDWSAEQMAAHLEPIDASLAAEYRKQCVTEASAPKSRKAPDKSEA